VYSGISWEKDIRRLADGHLSFQINVFYRKDLSLFLLSMESKATYNFMVRLRRGSR
jgi:hypothetical protein